MTAEFIKNSHDRIQDPMKISQKDWLPSIEDQENFIHNSPQRSVEQYMTCSPLQHNLINDEVWDQVDLMVIEEEMLSSRVQVFGGNTLIFKCYQEPEETRMELKNE